ncbi:MAG: biotin--[acetyl-CoA-carboxylase] ligase, partial [Alphaproteobacteria bacterium]|nr:biotin--[acetyl-CoA-carboxylase] ligase [Alphaproteobacteria bacterium]
ERAGDGAVVIGMGVNLAFHPSDLPRPVTSLAAQGAEVPVALFQQELADRFAAWLAIWRGQGLSAIADEWLARAHPIGTSLSVTEANGMVTPGSFAGLAADGALQLRLADGQVRAIHAGDIFLV